MDLQKIYYFFAVMEHRNLSAAAQALRVSQPTLSRQVQALEQEFETPLFVRYGRGVSPTEAAKRLHEGLRGLERQLHSLKSDVSAASAEPTGEIAFGIPPSPRALLATPLIGRFCKAYPRVTVRVSEETSGELRDLVAAGILDFAVTNIHEPMCGVVAEPLGTEPMLLVGLPGASYASKSEISIEQMADLPLILTTKPNSLRLTVESKLSQLGKRPNIRIEANTLPLMTDLVLAGLGYTVLPACGVRTLLKDKRLSFRRIADFNITWLIARSKSRSLNFAANRFCDLLREIAREKIDERVWQDPAGRH